MRLRQVGSEPWWLVTDHPVTTAEAAMLVFRMDCMRWAIEDTAKVAKQCLGWEEVQLLAYDAVRLLVALGWVAAGFLYELGVTLDWPEIRLLARLGGGEERADRPPGKQVLMRGLRRLFDLAVTEALLADEVRRRGAPPWCPPTAHRCPPRPTLPVVSYVRMSAPAPCRVCHVVVEAAFHPGATMLPRRTTSA